MSLVLFMYADEKVSVRVICIFIASVFSTDKQLNVTKYLLIIRSYIRSYMLML